MPPYSISGSITCLESYALSEDRDAALGSSIGLPISDVNFLAGIRALSNGDDAGLAQALSSLREIRILRDGSQPGLAIRSTSLSAAEIELELRSLLQTAASGDTAKLLTFLRRPDVLGDAIPSTFPVQEPHTEVRGGVERGDECDQRICNVPATAEPCFRPTAGTGIRNAQDIANLRGQIDPHFNHLLLRILFAALRAAADRKDVVLQRVVAEALLDILTKSAAGSGPPLSRSVPAISPSSLCLLLDDIMKTTAGQSSQNFGNQEAPVWQSSPSADRLQSLYNAATLEQLEAIASHESIRESRAWHTAVLARLTDDVQGSAAVAEWKLVDWEDYYSKLEDYAPSGPAAAIAAPISAAVAHLRLIRTFQTLLDPSKAAEAPPGDATATLAPLLAAAAAARRDHASYGEHLIWACAAAIDPHTVPSADSTAKMWVRRVLRLIWEAAVAGVCACGSFFDASGPIHEALVKVNTDGGAEPVGGRASVTCMHVMMGAAYTPGLARALGRFMTAQTGLLRRGAGGMHARGGETEGQVGAVEAAAELAAAHSALAAELEAPVGLSQPPGLGAPATGSLFGVPQTPFAPPGGAIATQASVARQGIAAAVAALPFYSESSSYERFSAATLLRFSRYTPQRSPPAAPLTVWVDAKNVGPTVTVSLYHIDLEGWLRGAQGGLEVGPDVDLTAVAPSEVLTVSTSGCELIHERLEVALPNTAGRRGTVVVDVAAGGKMCRAVIRRGSLQCMHRTTIAGHAFTLFYEDGSQPEQPCMRIDGRDYVPKATDAATGAADAAQASAQEIFVPFPAAPRPAAATLCDGGGAVSAVQVALQQEEFHLSMADTVLDPTALVPGSTATLPIRASLTLNGAPAPLSLLHDVRLTVSTTDMHGVEASSAAQDFALRELPHAAQHTLKVPEGCRRVAVALSARVTCMAPGANGTPRVFDLHQSAACEVATGDSGDAIAAAHLSLTPDGGAVIQVLGRCGEAIPEAPVTLQLKHRAWSQPRPPVQARTDSSGCIPLDSVQGLHSVSLSNAGCAALPERYTRTWYLPCPEPAPQPAHVPIVVEAGAENWVAIPLTGHGGAALLERGAEHEEGEEAKREVADVVLVSTTKAGRPLRRHAVRVEDACARASGLQPGHYRLDIHPAQCSFEIIVVPPPPPPLSAERGHDGAAVAPQDAVIGATTVRKCGGEMRPLSLAEPLHVRQFAVSSEHGIEAWVGGGSGKRVACITLSRFVPSGLRRSGVSWPAGRDGIGPLALAPSCCKLQERMQMGDEVQYVHDRRSSGHKRAFRTLPLDKPSMLTLPVKDGAARNVDLATKPPAAGVASAAYRRAPGSPDTMLRLLAEGCMGGPRVTAVVGDAAQPGLQFCGPALVLANVAVAATGALCVPAAELPEGWATGFSVARLEVFAADGSSAAAETQVTSDPPPAAATRPCVDPRAGRRLPPGEPHTRRKQAHACAVGETLTLDNAHVAKVTVIDRMHDVHALFTALLRVEHPGVAGLSSHATSAWKEFALLGNWGALSNDEKLTAVKDKACYELFLFLKFGDEPFFEAHVRPLLAQRAACERDVMTLVLTGDTTGLRACMGDMRVVSCMTSLEALLVAVELRDVAMLRAVLRRSRSPEAASLARHWQQKRFDVALEHGSLSASATVPAPPKPLPAAAQPAGPAALPSRALLGMAAPAVRHFGTASKGAGSLFGSAAPRIRHRKAAPEDADEEMVAACEEEVEDLLARDLVPMRKEAAAEARQEFAFEDTMAWREAGYWKGSGLDSTHFGGQALSAFWADLAEHILTTSSSDTAATPASPPIFLSRNVHTAPVDFTTAAAAAGLLARIFQGIPVRATATARSEDEESQAQQAQHGHAFDGCSLQLTAASPLFAFTHEVAVEHRVHPETPATDPHAAPVTTGSPSSAHPQASSSRVPRPAAGMSELLGYMCVVDPKDAFYTDAATGERGTKVATGPLLVHRVYTLRVIISNPTAEERHVEVLVPCPGGAVAVGGASFVDMHGYRVPPFACVQHEVKFYFPEAGEFEAPMASILRREILAQTVELNGSARIQVVTHLPPLPEGAEVHGLTPGSREWLLSTYATDADVLAALSGTMHALPMDQIAWRAKRSAEFHGQLLAVLRAAGKFDDHIWRLSLLHKDHQGILEWLAGSHGGLTRFVVPPFKCGAAQIGREAAGARLREFWPLINPRAHRLAGAPAFACPQLQAAWRQFLCCACRTPALSAEDLLEAACFMAAMDRLPEAGALLRRADAAAAASPVDSSANPEAPFGTGMQRDYLWAFLTLSGVPVDPAQQRAAEDEEASQHSMHDMLTAISAIVQRHAERVCAGRWAALWADMATYVCELQAQHAAQAEENAGDAAGAAMHADEASPAMKKRDAFLALDASEAPRGRIVATTPPPAPRAGRAAEGGEGASEWLEVAFREVDIEVAFSMRPFEGLQEGSGVAHVQPTWCAQVPVHASGTTEVDLSTLSPGGRVTCGVAEVRYRGLREEALVVAHTLSLQLQAERGLVTVLAPQRAAQRSAAADVAGRPATRKAPVEGAYVKVFARVGGNVKFWRDGYTDTLGRLEYARSTGTAASAQRFSLLVVSEGHGACMAQVDAPAAVRSTQRR